MPPFWCTVSSAPNSEPISSAILRRCGVILRRWRATRKIALLAAGGTENHVHLLLAVQPVLPLATALRELKAHSSRWMREHGQRFAWQEGYGAFSVSQSQRQVVMDYIAAQETHHAKWSFEQEFMTLLRKSGVEYDARFVFG